MDTFKRRRAEELCRIIEHYWAARGFKVRCKVYSGKEIYHDGRLCHIRSDLLNGCPRGAEGNDLNVYDPNEKKRI